MFDEAYNVVLLGELDEVEMIAQQLHSRFCDKDVNTMFHRSLGNGVVGVWITIQDVSALTSARSNTTNRRE